MPKQNGKKSAGGSGSSCGCRKSDNLNVKPSNDQLGENAGEGRAYKEMGKQGEKR